MNPPKGRIVVLGGTGFVGRALVEALGAGNVTLLRSRTRGPGGYDTAGGWMDADALRGADAVVNLAGSPIAVRWTASARREIHASRAATTALLVGTLARAGVAPRVLVSVTGANRYAAHPDAVLDESSPLDTRTFLGGVCRDWEAPLSRLAPTTRSVILPTGVVIGPGGAMAKLIPLFRLGLGGRLGHGRQWMPWIGRRDLVSLILHCLDESGPSGVLNAVNPEPTTNREFTRVIAAATHRPAVMTAPAWALRLAFGQMAVETLLDSRRLVPAATLRSGFRFSESLPGAVASSLR